MKKTCIGLAASSAVLLAFASPVASAADEERLPPQQVIAAIQAAVAANPGEIKEVEVDRKRGRLVVEVTIIGTDGAKREINVDPANNQVVK